MLENALKILNKFSDEGYEAYIVGGYVRDHLLNRPCKDIDITTNCLPEKVMELFPNNFYQSTKYKTVTIRMGDFSYEVTTYRTDSHYKDHRHPVTKVAKKLKSDVKRRDFTCNAICMDKNMNIIDYVGGREDIKAKIIKTVGNPTRRFNEDALRMLRAFRFASRLDFKIEKKTYEAIKHNAHTFKYVSKERIRDELSKMLLEPYFKNNLSIMINSGIFRNMPETLKALKILNARYQDINIIEFFALSSYYKGEPITDEFILSKKEQKFIEDVLLYVNKLINKNLDSYDLLDLNIEELDVALRVLSIIGKNYYKRSDIIELYNSMPIKSESDLSVNGNDIKKALNLEDSPLIKTYIKKALEGVLYNGIKNNKSALLKYLKEVKNEE